VDAWIDSLGIIVPALIIAGRKAGKGKQPGLESRGAASVNSCLRMMDLTF
jgi:hypothetical protein